MKLYRYAAAVVLLLVVVGCAGIFGKKFEYIGVESGHVATLNVSIDSVTNSLIPSFSGPEYTLSLYQDPAGKCATYSFPKPEHGYIGDVAVDIETSGYKTKTTIPAGKPLYIRSLFLNGGEMMCDQVYRFTPEVGKEYFFDFQQKGRNEFFAGSSAKCKVEFGMKDEKGEVGTVPGVQYRRKSKQFEHFNTMCK